MGHPQPPPMHNQLFLRAWRLEILIHFFVVLYTISISTYHWTQTVLPGAIPPQRINCMLVDLNKQIKMKNFSNYDLNEKL